MGDIAEATYAAALGWALVKAFPFWEGIAIALAIILLASVLDRLSERYKYPSD